MEMGTRYSKIRNFSNNRRDKDIENYSLIDEDEFKKYLLRRTDICSSEKDEHDNDIFTLELKDNVSDSDDVNIMKIVIGYYAIRMEFTVYYNSHFMFSARPEYGDSFALAINHIEQINPQKVVRYFNSKIETIINEYKKSKLDTISILESNADKFEKIGEFNL